MGPTPYIGITGFTTFKEVKQVLTGVPICTARHLVMVGVLVSAKTLRGETGKFPQRYPNPHSLARIFPSPKTHPDALNLIHFGTHDTKTLLHDMCWARELAGSTCHGFQLNVVWPAMNTLTLFKKEYPSTVLVLQCGEAALSEVNWDPFALAEKLRWYVNVVDYVLLDASGGNGREFDHAFINVAFREIAKQTPTLGLGVAGGLCPETVYRKLVPFMQQYNCSMDIEQGIRDSNDNLDISRAQRYFNNARALMYDYAP